MPERPSYIMFLLGLVSRFLGFCSRFGNRYNKGHWRLCELMRTQLREHAWLFSIQYHHHVNYYDLTVVPAGYDCPDGPASVRENWEIASLQSWGESRTCNYLLLQQTVQGAPGWLLSLGHALEIFQAFVWTEVLFMSWRIGPWTLFLKGTPPFKAVILKPFNTGTHF